jgi:hypothetical protein
MDGCTFTDMGTFVFQSNSDVLNSTFRRCDAVTVGGASFTNVLFANSFAASSVLCTSLALLDGCDFLSDGSNHAVELTSIGGGSMTWNCFLTGYVTGSSASPVTPTSTGNEAIYVNVASGTLTINVADGASIPSIRSAGATVNVVAGQKTFSFTVNPSITNYEWRIYSVTALGSLAGAVALAGEETATTDNQSYSYSYSSDIPIAVQIISFPDHDYEEYIGYFTLVNGDQDIIINLEIDGNNYEYITGAGVPASPTITNVVITG